MLLTDYILWEVNMTRFTLHVDFDIDSVYRWSPEISLDVFSIKDFVYDYMHAYRVNHLELFMSQNYETPFNYQFDCYMDFDENNDVESFWTERHFKKLNNHLPADFLEDIY